MRDPTHTSPAEAHAPNPEPSGRDEPSCTPEWLAYLLALLIRFMLQHTQARHLRRSYLAAWWRDRPDLPAGSIQAMAASIRGNFGTAIAWMCLRRGYGPDHPDWPYLSRTIVAFGGSLCRFRPGMPACGLQWFENPYVIPGAFGYIVPTPAAAALASLLSQQAAADARPLPLCAARAAARPGSARACRRPRSRPTGAWRRRSTGPPTGPPLVCSRQLSIA
jgi:hypothetical protein